MVAVELNFSLTFEPSFGAGLEVEWFGLSFISTLFRVIWGV
jgi:hypothetical protein